MYGSLVAGFETSCTISGWYHDGINIHGLGVGHPKDPMNGLKGGSFDESPPCKFPPNESLGCLPFGGWWLKPLSIRWLKTLSKCVTCNWILVAKDSCKTKNF